MSHGWADGIRPDPLMSVWEWADRYRILQSMDSGEKGPYRSGRTPYAREVMEEMSPHKATQKIVMATGAQIGKTSIGLNWIGHTVHLSPAPMLVVMPTVDLGKDFSDQRLAPMIEACPQLREKIPPARERDSGNRQLKKEFPGGLLLVRGANAPAGLRSMPIAKLFFDETDAAPADAGGEGSPIDLAIARTRTFPRRKILLTSTPTTPHGVIWREWLSSDQRRYHVPCPHCGEYQVLEWERLKYDPHDLDGMRPQMVCVKCGTGFDETAKAKWYGEDLGRWVKGNPDSEVAGFHLNSLYSPLGWYSWREAVRDYEKAKDQGEQALKAWTNTVLGEPWSDSAETPDWETLYKRREKYPRGMVPVDGVVLTAGVDIQRDRIEVEVVAWGARMESWSVDYVVIPGDTSTIQSDPAKECPWRQLRALLDKEWPLAEGRGKHRILRAAVDTGDQTATVYQWVREQRDNRILAIKGRDMQSSILGIPTPQDVTVRGKRVRRGIKLWGVGVSVAKTELYGWLKHEPSEGGGDVPRGLCHWPQYGESYFLSLTAEELQYTTLRGFRKAQWVKVRPRNEALDCRVYARAAAASLGVERWDADDWAARCVRARRMVAPPPPTAKQPDPAEREELPPVEDERPVVFVEPEKPKRRRGGYLDAYL